MQSHVMPRELERAGKGRYCVKGTELFIVQNEDGKQWKVEGHADDLGGFASRGAALGKLRELQLVHEVQPEQPVQPEADKQPVEEVKAETPDPTPAKRTRKAKATATA